MPTYATKCSLYGNFRRLGFTRVLQSFYLQGRGFKTGFINNRAAGGFSPGFLRVISTGEKTWFLMEKGVLCPFLVTCW